MLALITFSVLILIIIPYTVGWLISLAYFIVGIITAIFVYEIIWSYCYGNKSWIESMCIINPESIRGKCISYESYDMQDEENDESSLKKPPKKPLLTTKKIKTGNDKLDRSIDTLILVIMKEFVTYYYSSISLESINFTFIYETLILMVQEITQMIKSNNWTAFVSLKLNYELLTQVRIYLKSLENAEIKLVNPANKAQYKKCLDEFFDIEKQCTPKSFEKICCDDTQLFNYFYNLMSMILYHLLPHHDFNSKILRYSLQNVLAEQLVKLINTISEPTFINRFLITQLDKFDWITTDSLLNSIRYLADIKDINCLKNVITNYMAKLAKNDDSLKNWSKDVLLMNELDRICQIQFDSIKTGTIIIRTEEILQNSLDIDCETQNSDGIPEINFFDPSTNPNIIHFNAPILSYSFVIGNPDAINSFQQCLSENKLFQYFNLQLALRTLKNKFQVKVESTAYKSGLFLLRDPIVNGYQSDVDILIRDFKLDRNNDHFNLLDDSFFNEFQHILGEKSIDLLHIDKLAAIIDSVLASNTIYGRFTHSKTYLEMCINLKLLDASILDKYDDVLQIDGDVVGNLPTTSPNIKSSPLTNFKFISINIISFENQQLDNKRVTVYVVEVAVKKKNVKETMTIYRRYSDFFKFNTILSAKFNQVKNFGFPKKKNILSDNQSCELIQQRKYQMNNFISKLLNFEYCITNEKFIAEMKLFFTHPKWQVQNYPTLSTFNNINNEDILKSDDDGDNLILPTISMSAISRTSSSANLFDAPTNNNMNNTPRRDPNSSCNISYKGNIYNNELITLTKKLNPDFVEEHTLILFIQLIEEIAGLKQFNWLTRKWAGGLKQFILATYGDKFSKYLVDSVDSLLTTEYAITYVNTLRDCLVSYFEEDNDSDSTHIKAQFYEDGFARLACVLARIHFIGFNPSDAKKFLSEENITFSVNRFFHMFQYKELNKRLILVSLEKFLVILFKENSTQNFIDNI